MAVLWLYWNMIYYRSLQQSAGLKLDFTPADLELSQASEIC